MVALTVLLIVNSRDAGAELVDNGDGTITDTVSGLMWLKDADMNGAMTWAAANAWVQSLNSSSFAGHADWRLPSGANRDGSGTVCNSAPNGANCTATEFATLYFARLIMAFNPGPFQNLRAGSYWTSTDQPGDPSHAMAQDFIDGGQNPFDKSSPLQAWAVRDAGPLPTGIPYLYGVVGQGTNAGALIRIDTQNGAVTLVGDTGFPDACGLAFDNTRSRLYLSPCFGQAGIQVVDPNDGHSESLGALSAGVRSIAYRAADDRLYGVDISPALLSLDAETGGSDLNVVGFINQEIGGAIAARPSDGQLFGIGFTLSNVQRLLRLNHNPGSGPRDTVVATVGGAAITALAFHPDGRLFATDGTNLFTLNEQTGATSQRIPLQGVSIGKVGGLAVTSRAVPDVWIKDCSADTGATPSSPNPCANWRRSPDIAIDNNGDGHPDALQVGRTNVVRITVRNRGPVPALGTVVRLYAGELGGFPSLRTLLGQRTVHIGSGVTQNVRVSIPWRPARVRAPAKLCLIVVLDHSADRASAAAIPVDNNKAASCGALAPGQTGRPFP